MERMKSDWRYEATEIKRLYRCSTALAYEDSGSSPSVLVLIHGWGCDSSTLSRQRRFFEQTHRVVSIELRGHGQSDAPDQEYTVESYADDVVWVLDQLGVESAALLGHSMGGAIALEVGYRFPERVRAAVLIDTAFEAPQETQKKLAPLLPGLEGAEYEQTYRQIMAALSVNSDLTELRPLLLSLPCAPQHVLLSALHGHMVQHAFAIALGSFCRPLAYIATACPLTDVPLLKRLAPHNEYGQAVGVGHFAPWMQQSR